MDISPIQFSPLCGRETVVALSNPHNHSWVLWMENNVSPCCLCSSKCSEETAVQFDSKWHYPVSSQNNHCSILAGATRGMLVWGQRQCSTAACLYMLLDVAVDRLPHRKRQRASRVKLFQVRQCIRNKRMLENVNIEEECLLCGFLIYLVHDHLNVLLTSRLKWILWL